MSVSRLGYHLERRIDDNESVIACRKCGETVCSDGENFKRYALCRTMSLDEVGPRYNDPAEYVDDDVEFRQYYCPGCGTLLENEVILTDLEPIHDRELR